MLQIRDTGSEIMDERDLITKLIAGDKAAFRTIVRDLSVPMNHVARAIVGAASASDVVQDAWTIVVKSISRFEQRSSLKTWVLRIVSNAAKSHLRKSARTITAGDAGEVENAGLNGHRFLDDGRWADPPRAWNMDTPERLLQSEQLRETVFEVIGQLPKRQKAVLLLHDLEQLAFNEICNILDITDSNCRVLLHRARTHVWQAIEHLETR